MASTLEVSRYRENCSLFATRPVAAFEVALAKQLAQCSLASQGIDDNAMVCIAEALRSNTCLRELNLSGNDISQTGAMDLATSLGENRTLATLKLKGNTIGDAGMAAVFTALLDNAASAVSCVDCSATGITSSGLPRLMGSVAVNPRITALNLENNGLSAEAGGAIASALQRSPSLQVLCLGSNYLGDAGVAAVCQGLAVVFGSERGRCALTLLDLSRNGVGARGADSLAALLRARSCSLTDLLLAYNPLSAAGCIALATSVRDTATAAAAAAPTAGAGRFALKYLDVTGVDMGATGGAALAQAAGVVVALAAAAADVSASASGPSPSPSAASAAGAGAGPFVVEGLEDVPAWRAASGGDAAGGAGAGADALPHVVTTDKSEFTGFSLNEPVSLAASAQPSHHHQQQQHQQQRQGPLHSVSQLVQPSSLQPHVFPQAHAQAHTQAHAHHQAQQPPASASAGVHRPMPVSPPIPSPAPAPLHSSAPGAALVPFQHQPPAPAPVPAPARAPARASASTASPSPPPDSLTSRAAPPEEFSAGMPVNEATALLIELLSRQLEDQSQQIAELRDYFSATQALGSAGAGAGAGATGGRASAGDTGSVRSSRRHATTPLEEAMRTPGTTAPVSAPVSAPAPTDAGPGAVYPPQGRLALALAKVAARGAFAGAGAGPGAGEGGAGAGAGAGAWGDSSELLDQSLSSVGDAHKQASRQPAVALTDWGFKSGALTVSSTKRLKAVEDAVLELGQEIRWVDEEGVRSRLDAEAHLRARMEGLHARVDVLEEALAQSQPHLHLQSQTHRGSGHHLSAGASVRSGVGASVRMPATPSSKAPADSALPRDTLVKHVRLNEERLVALHGDVESLRVHINAVEELMASLSVKLEEVESRPFSTSGSDRAPTQHSVLRDVTAKVDAAVRSLTLRVEDLVADASARMPRASPRSHTPPPAMFGSEAQFNAAVAAAVAVEVQGMHAVMQAQVQAAVAEATRNIEHTLEESLSAAHSRGLADAHSRLASVVDRLDVLEEAVTSEQEASLQTLEAMMRATQTQRTVATPTSTRSRPSSQVSGPAHAHAHPQWYSGQEQGHEQGQGQEQYQYEDSGFGLDTSPRLYTHAPTSRSDRPRGGGSGTGTGIVSVKVSAQ